MVKSLKTEERNQCSRMQGSYECAAEGNEGPGTGNLNPEVDPTTTLTNDHGGAPSDRQGHKRSPETPSGEVQPTKPRRRASPSKRAHLLDAVTCLLRGATALRGLRAHPESANGIKNEASCDDSKETEKKSSPDAAGPRIPDRGGNDGEDGDKSTKPAEKDVERWRKRRNQRHQRKCRQEISLMPSSWVRIGN